MATTKEIEISLGAKDSELKGWEYTIPEGMEAEIKDGKIIVREKESEDKRIRKAITNVFASHKNYENFYGVSVKDILAWLKRQGNLVKYYEDKLDRCACSNFNKGYKKALEKQNKQQDVNMQINPSEYINDMGGNGCYLKNTTQNPVWSEEDEEIKHDIELCIEFFLNEGSAIAPSRNTIKEDALKWIQSIKDRVQPQPKQEWSEEDKGNLLDVKCIIDEVWHNQDVRIELDHSGEELESLWHWLDNIWQRVEYPQTTWKPSDEQLHYLSWIANIKLGDSVVEQEVSKHLNELYNDLKKLREE